MVMHRFCGTIAGVVQLTVVHRHADFAMLNANASVVTQILSQTYGNVIHSWKNANQTPFVTLNVFITDLKSCIALSSSWYELKKQS